jgi:hypothetical protein
MDVIKSLKSQALGLLPARHGHFSAVFAKSGPAKDHMTTGLL